jgi:hypothetical protein
MLVVVPTEDDGSIEKSPVNVTFVIERVAPPVFVTVSVRVDVCAATDVLRTRTAGNAAGVVAEIIAGTTPLPLTVTVSSGPDPLLAVITQVLVPIALGTYVMSTVVPWPEPSTFGGKLNIPMPEPLQLPIVRSMFAGPASRMTVN